jgi:hypothetical protein
VKTLERQGAKFVGELSTWERKMNAGSISQIIAELTVEVIAEVSVEGDDIIDVKGENFWVASS